LTYKQPVVVPDQEEKLRALTKK